MLWTPFISNLHHRFISDKTTYYETIFDSEATIRRKAKYFAANRLAGVLIDHLGADDYDNNCKKGAYPFTKMVFREVTTQRCIEDSMYCTEDELQAKVDENSDTFVDQLFKKKKE